MEFPGKGFVVNKNSNIPGNLVIYVSIYYVERFF